MISSTVQYKVMGGEEEEIEGEGKRGGGGVPEMHLIFCCYIFSC